MTDEQRDAEREALDALLASNGWRVMLTYIDRNWGPAAYRLRCQMALRKIPMSAGNVAAMTELTISEMEAVASAMELLQQWPVQRLKQLSAEKPAPARRRRPPSRGATPNE